MVVWSLSGADWAKAAEAAGGVTPVLCPPADDETVELTPATAADIVYLNLHGYKGQGNYYGQKGGVVGPTALTPDLVRQYRWDGVVVFAEVCWSAADGGGEMAQAFLENGARAFIGSTTEAYGRIRPTIWDGEADRLMWLFRKFYPRTRDANAALTLSKRALAALSFPLDRDDIATIQSFVCLEAKTHDKETVF